MNGWQNLSDMTKNFSQDGTTKSEYERVKFIVDCENEQQGDLNEFDHIDCPICKNKGRIAYVQKNEWYKDSEEYDIVYSFCSCWKKRQNYRKIANTNLGKENVNKKIKDYIVTTQWQNDFKKRIIDYCKETSFENEKNSWLLLCGSSGCGKSLLCCIVANNYVFNFDKDIEIIVWNDFINEVKSFNRGSEETYRARQMLNDIKNVDVLVIDELFKGNYTDRDRDYANDIINYRYNLKLPTIISTERTFKELLDINEATFSRVFAMTQNGRFILKRPKIQGKNFNFRLQSELGLDDE